MRRETARRGRGAGGAAGGRAVGLGPAAEGEEGEGQGREATAQREGGRVRQEAPRRAGRQRRVLDAGQRGGEGGRGEVVAGVRGQPEQGRLRLGRAGVRGRGE